MLSVAMGQKDNANMGNDTQGVKRVLMIRQAHMFEYFLKWLTECASWKRMAFNRHGMDIASSSISFASLLPNLC